MNGQQAVTEDTCKQERPVNTTDGRIMGLAGGPLRYSVKDRIEGSIKEYTFISDKASSYIKHLKVLKEMLPTKLTQEQEDCVTALLNQFKFV